MKRFLLIIITVFLLYSNMNGQIANIEAMVEVGKVAVSQLFDIRAQLATDEVTIKGVFIRK